MHACSSSSRQFWLKSAADKLLCDHFRQRDAERWIANWKRKSEDNNEKTLSFVLTSENKIYTETIFLPISISLQESQKIIQMEIEKMNSDILELLEYGETRDINLEYLKKLKSLSEIIKQIKNEQTQRLLLEKNTL